MPALSGTIEVVSIKPLNQPDRFGNTFRASLKVGEDWISWGGVKKEAIDVKDGSGWTQLAKGMQVEFMYDLNGDFKNIKKASLSITDKSNAQAAPAPSQQASKPQAQQQQSSGGFVNPAARGQAMNLAAEVLGYKKADFENSSKIVAAIKWYLKSAKDFEALWDTAEKEIVAENTAKPKPKAAPVEDKPPFDEDIDMGYDDDLPV